MARRHVIELHSCWLIGAFHLGLLFGRLFATDNSLDTPQLLLQGPQLHPVLLILFQASPYHVCRDNEGREHVPDQRWK